MHGSRSFYGRTIDIRAYGTVARASGEAGSFINLQGAPDGIIASGNSQR